MSASPEYPRVAALLTAQIERVWGRGEVDLVDTMYADDVVDRMPIAGQPAGRAALKDVVRAFRTAMPDLVMELHGVLVAGDRGVDFWTLRGTHTGPLFGIPATGRRVCFSGIDMVRVAQGRIAELWHVEEMAQFADQLGVALPGDPGTPRGIDTGYWLPDPAALSPREARNLAAMRRHGEATWGAGKLAAGSDLYAPDIVDLNARPGQRAGGDPFADLRDAAPDLQVHVAAYVPAGNHVADRWTMTSIHTGAPLFGIAARGKRFEIAGMTVARFDTRGRIDQLRHVEELARLSAQIA